MKKENQTFALPITTSGAGATVAFDLSNAPNQSATWLQFIGPFIATYVVESSLDGATWYAVNGSLVNDLTAAATPPTNVTAPGLFAYYPSLKTRIRCTAYTSGTGSVMISGDNDLPYA